MNPIKPPCRTGRRPPMHVLCLLLSSTSVAHASYLRHAQNKPQDVRQLPEEPLPKISGVPQPPAPTPQTNTTNSETLSSLESEISTIESELTALQSTDDASLTDDQFAAKISAMSSLEAQEVEEEEEELELMMEGAEDDETLEMLEAEEEELKEEGEGEWDDLTVGDDDLVQVMGEEGLEEELEEVTEEIEEIEAEDDDGASALQKEAFEEELENIKNDIEEVILENEQLGDDDGYAVYKPDSNSTAAVNKTSGITAEGLNSVMLGGPDSLPANINIDPTLTMDLTQYNPPVGGTGAKEATSPVGNMESEPDRHGINSTTPEVLESEAEGATEEAKTVSVAGVEDDDDDYVIPPPKKVTPENASETTAVKDDDDDFVLPSNANNVTSVATSETVPQSATADNATLETVEAEELEEANELAQAKEEEEEGDWDDYVPPTVPPKNSAKNATVEIVSGSKGNVALNSTASVVNEKEEELEKLDEEIEELEAVGGNKEAIQELTNVKNKIEEDIIENEQLSNATTYASNTTVSAPKGGTPDASETEEIEDLESGDDELTNVKNEIEEDIIETEQLGNATTSELNTTISASTGGTSQGGESVTQIDLDDDDAVSVTPQSTPVSVAKKNSTSATPSESINATEGLPENIVPGKKNATADPIDAKPKSPVTQTHATHTPPPDENPYQSTSSPSPGRTYVTPIAATLAATPAPIESLISASPPTPKPTYRPTEGKVTYAPSPKPTYDYEEPTDDSLDPVVSEQNAIDNEAFSNGEALPPASGGGRDVDDFLREEEEEVKKVGGWMSFAALVLMIYTAYQMSENPDGFCASLCRLVITVLGCIVKILLIPFKYVLGGGRSSGGHYMATPSYRDPYGSRHMELT